MLELIFTEQNFAIGQHLCVALICGMVIGYERSFHGRPAGFRTHTLVCLASTMLMTIPLYASSWFPGVAAESMRMDPTRMAQGIMTGIGFLGAGVIYKEGMTVRGLTTAASIWVTASIGILVGAGFYVPAFMATLTTICVLGFFPKAERAMPKKSYVHFIIVLDRANMMTEEQVCQLVEKFGFRAGNISYHRADGGGIFEYRMTIRTSNADNAAKLAAFLSTQTNIRSFQIYPSGD